MVPQGRVKVNVLNLSNKVKFLDLLKASMYIAKVGWCYGEK
jgi:hypothetical protein